MELDILAFAVTFPSFFHKPDSSVTTCKSYVFLIYTASSVSHIWGFSGILGCDMRKQPAKQANYEETLSVADLADSLQRVIQRLGRLEEEVFGVGVARPETKPAKKKMGRKPKLDQQELLNRRDQLVGWMEQVWPALSVALRKENPHEAIAAINRAKKLLQMTMQEPPFYKNPELHLQALSRFFKSKRFYGNPRNLAAAMAGIPELSWKTSLNICLRNACKLPMGINAYWDHLRRNFPDRLRELQSVSTPEQVKAVLAKSRTQDPIYVLLKEHPHQALEWLNSGRP